MQTASARIHPVAGRFLEGATIMETQSKFLVAALATALIGIPLAVYALQSEAAPGMAPESGAAISLPARLEQVRFGPGMPPTATVGVEAPAAVPAAPDQWAPAGLEATPDRHLAITREMRTVFDYFLQPASPGDRSSRVEKLQAHMSAKLPPEACAEARPIVSSYVDYLAAVDTLDANEKSALQNPAGTANAEQMTARMSELSRLRQTVLGVRLAQLWFADEEIGMRQYIARRGHTPKVLIPES
jgi:hypothetical protein